MKRLAIMAVGLALTGCATVQSVERFRDHLISVQNDPAWPKTDALTPNSKWVAYSPYLKNMMGTIQTKWDRIIGDGRKDPPTGTYVTVAFKLDSNGRISEITEIGGTSNEYGKRLCVGAITLAAPYGRWTDEMVSVLGTSQELKIRFFYD